MKITTTLCALLLLSAPLFGQSPARINTTDWKSVASKNTISQKNVINVKRLGADPTGKEPADKYVQMALNNSKQTGAFIYFPKGTYLLTSTISLTSNQYLAGDGSNQTTLKFDLKGSGHLITATGKTFAGWSDITSETKKDEIAIKTPNEFLETGDLVRIKIDDGDKITSSWASGTVGQICQIAKVEKDKVTFTDELRLDLLHTDHPKIIKILPQENVGVLNLRIIRKDKTGSQTDNIRFQYTKNALVSGVHSDSCNFSHVNNLYSYANRIEGSFFTNAFDYGNGGKAYGVVLGFTSGECMVENNSFQKLRHSILFQAGPNGNIVGYNYSEQAYWTGVFTPSDFAGDIVMHGNYPFLNLIEGNIIQNLVIDNSHGPNGPGNTFLRNRIQNAGIFMNCSPATDNQIFIGNEITGTGTSSNGLVPFPKGLYSLCGTGHYEFGNNQNGKMIPAAVNELISSFYLPHQPDFISNSQFPAIGYPLEFNKGSIPAYDRRNNTIRTVDFEFEVELGVRFKTIVAKKDNDRVNVSWTTNTLTDCETFEVFRKYKGQDAVNIAKIDCSKSTNTSFRFTDYNMDPTKDDALYYVHCIDIFGGQIVSDSIEVIINEKNASISSDGQGQLFFDYLVQELKVYDLQGHLVHQQAISDRRYQLPNDLISGVYVVEVLGNNQASRTNVGVFR